MDDHRLNNNNPQSCEVIRVWLVTRYIPGTPGTLGYDAYYTSDLMLPKCIDKTSSCHGDQAGPIKPQGPYWDRMGYPWCGLCLDTKLPILLAILMI